jgi:hypothetical protein
LNEFAIKTMKKYQKINKKLTFEGLEVVILYVENFRRL